MPSYLGNGRWGLLNNNENVGGGVSWNRLIGGNGNSEVTIKKTYFSSYGTIDLGAGIDTLFLGTGGRHKLFLSNVEFVHVQPVEFNRGTLVHLELKNPVSNTFTTDGTLKSLWGTGGVDTITFSGFGAAGFNSLTDLGFGNDELILAGINVLDSNDTIHGGAGTDILRVSTVTPVVLVNDDNFTTIEHVILTNGANRSVTLTNNTEAFTINGGDGNDTITSGNGNDTIYGGDGVDIIDAAGGNDIIYSGTGDYNANTNSPGNQLTGGAGSDTFNVGYGNGAAGLNDTAEVTGGALITDWDAGTDTLNVSPNGKAHIGGLYAVNGLAGSDIINLSLNTNNLGIVYAYGLGGNDTITGTAGRDVIYGGSGTNFIDLGVGSVDAAVIDTRSGVQHVTNFESNRDVIRVDEKVINALGTPNTRVAGAADVTGDVIVGQTFNKNVDYGYQWRYNSILSGYGAGPYSNAEHNAAEDGADNFGGFSTATAGGILIGVGAALLASTFGIVGAAQVVAGGLLVSGATPHQNPSYRGLNTNLDNWMNVIVAPRQFATNAGQPDNIPFLSHFGTNLAGWADSYTNVIEFTDHAGPIYSYVAIQNSTETFIYLVRSADNIVENHEAILVAEINGQLTAANFTVYNSDNDIDKYIGFTADEAIILHTPTITQIQADNDGIDDGNEAILVDGSITANSRIRVDGTIAASNGLTALPANTVINLYEGSTSTTNAIQTATLGGGTTSFSLLDPNVRSSTFEVISASGAGNIDQIFRLADFIGNYYTEIVNQDSGFITRSDVFTVTVDSFGNSTIDGGDGNDTLLLEKTSASINNATDAQIVSIENVDGSSSEAPIRINLSLQTEAFTISGSSLRVGPDNTVISTGNDTLTGGRNNDLILPGSGIDYVDGFDGNDTVNGGSFITDADTIIGGNGTDTLQLAGRYITGQLGALTAANNISTVETILLKSDTNNTGQVIQGQTLPSATDGYQYDITVDNDNDPDAGFSLTDVLTVDASDLKLDGNGAVAGAPAETLRFSAAGVTLFRTSVIGGEASDTITGSELADTIIGGAGEDNLSGGAGSDTFVLTTVAELPNDTIDGGAGDNDAVRLDAGGFYDFTTATVSNIETISVNANQAFELVLSDDFNSDNGNVEIVNSTGAAITNSIEIDASSFVGGTAGINVSSTDFNGDDSFVGSLAADTIMAGAGNDEITGGAGADSLVGGDGDDRYFFNTGDVANGEEVIELAGGGTDTFLVVTSTDFSALAANNLDEIEQIIINAGQTATFTGEQLTGEAIAINGVNNTNDTTLTINVAAGTSVNFSALTFANLGINLDVGLDTSAFDSGADVVSIVSAVGATAETIVGSSIADTISTDGGNDVIDSGDGNDTINAGDGDDTINGGAGADSMDGGDGNDVFIITDAAHHAAGETITGGNGIDVIRFTSTAGATLTLTSTVDVEEARITDAAGVATGTTNESINATSALGTIALYGNDGANSLTGNAQANVIVGGAGDDTITGGAGADIINAGAGTNLITDAGNGADIITHNAGAGVVNINVTGTDTVTLSATSTNATATVANAVAGSVNASSSIVAVTLISTSSANVTFVGGSGPDVITGGSGDDTITGGGGADNMDGGSGNDVFIIADAAHHSAGETITGGADTDVIRFTSTAGATLTLTSTVDVEEARITDAAGIATGTTNESINATSAQGTIALYGNDGANSLTGNAQANVIVGGAGDDTITGGAGADVINAGSGANQITDAGVGADIITHSDAASTVAISVTGSDTVTLTATQLGATATATAGGNRTVDASSSNATGAVVINGAALTAGQAGVFTGGAGSDTIIGGAGSDTITGGGGGDRIAFGAADGAVDTLIIGATDTSTAVFADGGSTVAMDIISQAEIGDILDIVPDLSGTAVTFATSDTDYLPGNANAIHVIRGTYNTAGQIFAYDEAGNDYMVQWSQNGDASVSSVIFEDYGTQGLNFTVGAGLLTLAAAPALNITLIEVSSAGITTQGNGPHRGYFTNGDQDPIRNDAGTYHFKSDNIGASTNYTFTLAQMQASASGALRDGLIAIQATNSGVNSYLPARVYVGGQTDTNDTIIVDLTATTSSTTFGIVYGNGGNDNIVGSTGDDYLFGGAGNDTITGGGGADTIDGGPGTDTYIYASNAEFISGGAVVDQIFGADGNDVIRIDAPIVLTTSDSMTRVNGGVLKQNATGAASIVMNSDIGGIRTFDISSSTANSTINFTGINGVQLTIVGGSGNDTITGGGGGDILTGGAGADTFVMTAKVAADGDTITDWTTAVDKLQVSIANYDVAGVLAAIGAGNSIAAQFTSFANEAALTGGSVAASTDAALFIHLQDTGAIYYNTDAATAGGFELIALVGLNSVVVDSDWVIGA